MTLVGIFASRLVSVRLMGPTGNSLGNTNFGVHVSTPRLRTAYIYAPIEITPASIVLHAGLFQVLGCQLGLPAVSQHPSHTKVPTPTYLGKAVSKVNARSPDVKLTIPPAYDVTFADDAANETWFWIPT